MYATDEDRDRALEGKGKRSRAKEKAAMKAFDVQESMNRVEAFMMEHPGEYMPVVDSMSGMWIARKLTPKELRELEAHFTGRDPKVPTAEEFKAWGRKGGEAKARRKRLNAARIAAGTYKTKAQEEAERKEKKEAQRRHFEAMMAEPDLTSEATPGKPSVLDVHTDTSWLTGK